MKRQVAASVLCLVSCVLCLITNILRHPNSLPSKAVWGTAEARPVKGPKPIDMYLRSLARYSCALFGLVDPALSLQLYHPHIPSSISQDITILVHPKGLDRNGWPQPRSLQGISTCNLPFPFPFPCSPRPTNQFRVRLVHHVPHRLDVLLRHQPRKPFLRPGILARPQRHPQDPLRERGDPERIGETAKQALGPEGEAVGDGGEADGEWRRAGFMMAERGGTCGLAGMGMVFGARASGWRCVGCFILVTFERIPRLL